MIPDRATESCDEGNEVSEARVTLVLKQAQDGTVVVEVCRKVGFSEATFYNWRKASRPDALRRQIYVSL